MSIAAPESDPGSPCFLDSVSLQMKSSLNTTRLVRIALLVLALTSSSCEKLSPCDEEEIARRSSQDEMVDAIVVRNNCGATSGYSYKVYVARHGDRSLAETDVVFLSDQTTGLEISWIAPKTLRITYEGARIFKFTNFWQSADVENFRYVVTVTEMARTSTAN